MKNLRLLGLAIVALFAFTACDDTTEGDVKKDIPSTYNFENVSYKGQIQRQDMLGEMADYMNTATNGEVVDAQVLLNMYANDNSPFESAELNEADSKELENKTVQIDQSEIKKFLREFAAATLESDGREGSNGVPGVVTSTNNPGKKYFFAANGFDYIQLVKKGIMGSCFYFQATSVYLSPEKMDVDNETIEEGKGTSMEHHWDEAFGYFGVPTDFPANTEGARNWGAYSNKTDAQLNSNETMMNAFIKGRFAISNKDMETRDEQIEIIRNGWERLSAGTAVHYLNAAKASFADDAMRNHVLSESWGFIHGLKYNPSKKISNAEVDEVLAKMGDNFYEITIDDINAAKAILVSVYGFEDIQDQL